MKSLKYIIGLFIIVNNAFLVRSQTTWDLNGNTAGSTDILGTTNSVPLKIYSGNTERIRILDNNGNVGINTTSPNYLLHQDGGTGTATYHQFTNGSTTGTTSGDGMLVGTDASANGIINMLEAKPINLSTAGSTRMTILGSGNTGYIGMGTTSPSSVLHIDGNGTPTPTGDVFQTDGSSSATQYWKMYRGGTLKAQLSNNTSDNNVLNALVGNLILNSAQTGTGSFVGLSINSQTKLRVINNGNIGIGPGFGDPKSLVHLNVSSTNDAYQQFTNDGTTGNSNSSQGFKIGIEGSTGKAIINQQENAAMNFLTNATQRMTILSSGEVGIGTSSPASLFQVHSGDEQLTNSTTGATSSDGFLLKLNSSAVELKQQENDDMKFFTNNTQQAIIKAGGNVGINESSPTAKLQVKGTSTSNNDLGFLITDSGGNNYLQAHNGGSVIIGNGLGNTAGALGVGVHLANTLTSRLEINGASGTYGRCIEVDDTSGGYPIFYVMDTKRVGIGLNTPNHTLELYDDDAAKTTTSTWTVTSDIRLKTDTSLFTDGLNVVRQVHPVNYKYKGATGLDSVTNNIGLIAQEIQPVAPYVIRDSYMKLDTNDANLTPVLGVNMHAFWFILMNAVKELDANNQALMSRIDQLESQVSGMNGSKQSNPDHNSKTSINVELSNSGAIILDQNVPNPFADQTTISYTIPDGVIKAQIIFYNNNGSVLKIVDVIEKGKGEVNVFAPDLSSGIYSYTLIADGKVIETKKMVKQ